MIDLDPFAELEVEPEQIQDPKYLNQEQLLFWLHLEFSSPKAQEAAYFFSLCCLTGFHYIDLVQVIKNPKEYLKKRTGWEDLALQTTAKDKDHGQGSSFLFQYD